MYESYFGFREKPFSLLPDPSFLYLGRQHAASLAMLEYGLANQAGFTVLTGEIGCGKTTLLRHLLDEIGDDVTVGMINNTHPSFGELLQWILMSFGLEYDGKSKVQLYQTFVDFIIGEYARKHRTVLIIDEAQNMGVQTLEELRMLSNINADKDQVLQLILVGQPELRTTLTRPELVQFAQRVAVDFHLERFGPDETRDYIRHRVEKAGGDPAIFRPDSYEVVHERSEGVPRLINVLCDTALVYAYGAQRRRINAELINEVAADRDKVRQRGANGSKARPMPLADRVEQQRVSLEVDRETLLELFGELRDRKKGG